MLPRKTVARPAGLACNILQPKQKTEAQGKNENNMGAMRRPGPGRCISRMQEGPGFRRCGRSNERVG